MLGLPDRDKGRLGNMGWELGSWAHGAGIRSGREHIGLGECGSFRARSGVCAACFFSGFLFGGGCLRSVGSAAVNWQEAIITTRMAEIIS